MKTGMILAKDVKNGQGQLLLRSGMAIQERHLILLSSWGVTETEIQDGDTTSPRTSQTPAPTPSEQDRRLEESRNALREKFRHNNLESPVIVELLELCARRKSKL